jgi:hypothetical protein
MPEEPDSSVQDSEEEAPPQRGDLHRPIDPRRQKAALAVLVLGFIAGAAFFGWMVCSTPASGKPPAPSTPPPVTQTSAPDASTASADAPKPSPPPAQDETPIAGSLDDPATQGLLASQTEEKRNEILLIDFFRQTLNRYPNAKEQAQWTSAEGSDVRALRVLRGKGASETDVANYIAGAVMDSAMFKSQAPALVVSGVQDSAAAVGTIVARVIHYRDDIPPSRSQGLMLRLKQDFGLSGGQTNQVATVTRLLRGIAGTTDIGEHFLEDRNDDRLEVAAMRTLLRQGKLLVLNGNDVESAPRYIVVFGFDREGTFLVRDPLGKMPEKVPPLFLLAFMRKPALMGDASGAGFWLDLPRGHTHIQCVSHPVAVSATEPKPAKPLFLAWAQHPEVTGIIPGAQVNLSPARIPPGEHSLKGTLTITAEQIDAILQKARSPAMGSGRAFVRWGQYYNVDPVYALAFFRRESVLGTHPRWVGRKSASSSTRNIGNIRYVGRPNPQRSPQYGEYNGFRDYTTWEDGIHDWFKLIAQDSNYAGLHTVERILPRYAPVTENDTGNYIRDVITWAEGWRQQSRSAGAVQVAAAKLDGALEVPTEVECKPPSDDPPHAP